MKAELLTKQGKALVQVRDYFKAGHCYQEAAELLETMDKPAEDMYREAGNAYVMFAEGMIRVKNESKAEEGYMSAISSFEKAGMPEEVERIRQEMKPEI